jgi:rod shape-determining protein MreD
MADAIVPRRWRLRALYGVLGFLVIFTRLLPLDTPPGQWPGPDVLLLLTYAWVLRRPEAVPVTLVTAMVLLTDVLFMRPLGLWTACVILGLEFLRARAIIARDIPFLGEWLMVSATILAITMLNALVLALFVVLQPALGQVLMQSIATVLTYPVVVLFSSKLFGIRKLAPGSVDQLGHRL